jgi:hypothetical protein
VNYSLDVPGGRLIGIRNLLFVGLAYRFQFAKSLFRIPKR